MNNIIELYVCNINGYYSRSCLFLCICVSCCFVTLSWPCICLGRTEKNWYALLCNNDREHSHNFICNNNGHFQWMSHSHNATGFSKRFMNGVFFVVGWCGGVAIGVCVALPFFFFISFSCVVFICCVCLPSFFACVAIAHCVMWCVCVRVRWTRVFGDADSCVRASQSRYKQMVVNDVFTIFGCTQQSHHHQQISIKTYI